MSNKSKSGLAYVKTTMSKGRRYWYFDTGKLDAKGKRIFTRLPDPKDKVAFGCAYAALVGHRSRVAAPAGTMTVSTMLGLYQKSADWTRLSDGSRAIYGIYLREIESRMGHAEADKVFRKDMALMVDKRADKPAAANMLLKVARVAFAWGRKRGHTTADPCADIDLNELGEHSPWPADLLAEALTTDNARVRLAAHLLYYTAQRIGDVAKMQFGDIQKDGTLYVKQQKTGKELWIPIHSNLRTEIDAVSRQVGPIIISELGRAISVVHLRDNLKKWASERGHAIVPHGLRKNAVIALLEAGCTVAQTASISGQTLQLVEHYAKQRDQRKLAAGAMKVWEGNGR